MPYFNKATGTFGLSIVDVKNAHPDIGIPNLADAYGDFVRYVETGRPAHNPSTQKVVEQAPKKTAGIWTQQWQIMTLTADEIAAAQNQTEQQAMQVAKLQRQRDVDVITVTTVAGNTFDGDEISQGRMARAVIGLSAQPGAVINWVLADNTIIAATAAELTEALALAGAAQGAIWVRPYQ